MSRKSRKVSIKSDRDDKIKKHFKHLLKKYKGDYLLGSVWTNPVSGKQIKVTDKDRRLLKEVKSEMNIKGKRCSVTKSKTGNRDDLIKELRSYVRCLERKTGRNQDLSMERLKTESLSDIKKHLKFYRDNNDL